MYVQVAQPNPLLVQALSLELISRPVHDLLRALWGLTPVFRGTCRCLDRTVANPRRAAAAATT